MLKEICREIERIFTSKMLFTLIELDEIEKFLWGKEKKIFLEN
jgi:hypothetical protein